MITSKDIERETQVLKRRIDKIERKYSEIKEEGSLRICRKKKQTDFYYRKNSGDRWSYIPKAEAGRAGALAQKDYYKRVLEILKRKYRAFAMLHGQSANDALLELYDSLHPERRRLISAVYLSDDEFIENWKNESLPPKKFDPEDKSSHYTDNGERVRSKSEVMIANLFLKRGVLYLYEPGLQLNERVIYPDFRVLNRRIRKTFYFENFGMMDNPEYSAKAVQKINAYILNGFLPGDGLIYSMETSEHPLDMRVVERMIDRYLV